MLPPGAAKARKRLLTLENAQREGARAVEKNPLFKTKLAVLDGLYFI